ncbi:MAG: hypothetical protein ABL962_13965 [Fimbriimonadaceae bacterium]
MRKSLLTIFGLIPWALASAQSSMFELIKPDVLIVIERHRLGADIVEITMVKDGYPKDLLEKQILRLGTLLGSAPRGLAIGSPNLQTTQTLRFVRASFGIDGITDPKNGKLRIEPILKAFAGAPKPYTIGGINILFDKFVPTKTTVRQFGINNVVAGEGRYNQDPAGLEYRIQLLSQDEALIKFPDRHEAENETAPSKPSSTGDNRVLLISIFAVMSLALGALVYLLLLRGAPKVASKKR